MTVTSIHGGETLTSDWRHQAACARVDDPDLFHPVSYDGPTAQFQVQAAKTICASCPVKPWCLNDALGREGRSSAENRRGIFGGLTPQERADRVGVGRLKRERRAAA